MALVIMGTLAAALVVVAAMWAAICVADWIHGVK